MPSAQYTHKQKTPTHPQRAYRSSRVQMVVIKQWRLEEITQRNA